MLEAGYVSFSSSLSTPLSRPPGGGVRTLYRQILKKKSNRVKASPRNTNSFFTSPIVTPARFRRRTNKICLLRLYGFISRGGQYLRSPAITSSRHLLTVLTKGLLSNGDIPRQ